MSRKKVPLATIGSAVPGAALSLASMPATTSVQPSAFERAGDALGQLLWKSVPVLKAVAIGADRGHCVTGDGRPWLETSHHDDLQWRKHRESD